METKQDFWRNCSSCKKPISFGANYYVCSVSTCNGQRTGYAFCSVSCFERHLPGARHKDAGAIEKKAPMVAEPGSPEASGAATGPVRRIVSAPSAMSASGNATNFGGSAAPPREVLVIASRLKDYIQARAGYNTSASVMDFLSDHLRVICERAIDNARADGRKTVMDRDFEFLKKG